MFASKMTQEGSEVWQTLPAFLKPWEQAPHPQGIRSTQSTPVGKVSQQGLVESPCLSCPITVKMKQPTIVLRTAVEFGMGNYLGLYQITKDVSFYKCHNVYISSSLWFWWKWSWKFLVCFIVFPLPSEVQKLNYYLLVFYFKDCLFAFRNHYENKKSFLPLSEPPLSKGHSLLVICNISKLTSKSVVNI